MRCAQARRSASRAGVALTRSVGGQCRGFDPPAAASRPSWRDRRPDGAREPRCTAEAFADAGMTPEELLAPCTRRWSATRRAAGWGQGVACDGCCAACRAERMPDRLQEALGNVVAAHVNQGLVGGYGPMVQPVARLRHGRGLAGGGGGQDRAGKARRSSSGGWDDLRPRASSGSPTCPRPGYNDELDGSGIAPHEASRANDLRRAASSRRRAAGAARRARLGRAGARAARARRPGVRGQLRRRDPRVDPGPGMGVLAAVLGGRSRRSGTRSRGSDWAPTTSPSSPSTTRRRRSTTPTRPTCTSASRPRSAARRATRCSSSRRRRSPATRRAAPPPGRSAGCCR